MDEKEFGKKLKDFLYYLEDKVEHVYKKEVNEAVKRFLKENKKEVKK